ncbi:MAG: lactonase family protein [Ardenticatenaceae bacterium]
MENKKNGELVVYVGTYTQSPEEGIYVYRLALSSGALTYQSQVSGMVNPSFLAIDPTARYLYAVREVPEEDDPAVIAFSIDPTTKNLTYLNEQSSHGGSPAHLTVDQSGKFVFVANYGGGNVAVLPTSDNGQLGKATDVVEHQVASLSPHPHSTTLDERNRFAFVPDLGLDKIMIYEFDLAQGSLAPNGHVQLQAGAGPRHFTFHPNGRHAVVINENDSTITAFAYDDDSGTLTQLQTISTLPHDFSGTSYCADIHISPSGKFLYGSNRGHDSIVIFAIEKNTERLTYVGHEPTKGQYPRNFAIDPTGSYLLAANQHSNTVVTFRINQQTGELNYMNTTKIPRPVCLQMLTQT